MPSTLFCQIRAGDKAALGGSQKGEVEWLEDNYSIPLHIDVNRFVEIQSKATPTEPTDVTYEQKEGSAVITFQAPSGGSAANANTTH